MVKYALSSLLLDLQFNLMQQGNKEIDVIDVIDDITIMLTLVKLHSGYYYSQQHEFNTNIARLWV